MIIKTTIDTNLQSIADKALYEGLLEYDKKQGWRGVLDNINYLITSNKFNNKDYVNPFPNKWKIVQIIKNDAFNKVNFSSLNLNS